MSRLFVARNKRVAARSLDGEMMIMSGRDSTLFTLNKTATIIWQAADGATPLDEIVERRICAEYRVECSAALQDAEAWARELAAHGILDVSEDPIPSANAPLKAFGGEPRLVESRLEGKLTADQRSADQRSADQPSADRRSEDKQPGDQR